MEKSTPDEKIVREDGVFRAELRSPQEGLNVTRGRIYQGLCDAEFGDSRCGVPAASSTFRGTGSIVAVLDAFRLRVSGLGGFEAGWFAFGAALWTSGARTDLRDPVIAHHRGAGGDVLVFAEPVGEHLAVGDAMVVTAGCDRRFATCRDRFDNAVNFRGFPHIPGSDFVLRLPKAGDALDGRAVVR
jgi:uncharacterized phage protein (TIGR02218 family)